MKPAPINLGKELGPRLVFGLVVYSLLFPREIDAQESVQLVWPAPPAEARVEYVKSFSTPGDLGIKKGFFRRLGEVFTGSEQRQLVRPMSVVERKGIIYVGDPGAQAVHEFDTRRNRHRYIQLAERKPLPSPVGLAHDKRGRIYIADSVLAGIFVYERGDKFARLMKLAEPLKQPTGIVVDQKSGDIYVTDTTNHRILVFNKHGELLRKFGRRGENKLDFNYPTMLWRNTEGELLVTDSLNFRIQTLSADGKFVRSFGKLGNATGYLSRPKGVAVDANGYIYVIDSLFHAMQIFDAEGRLMLSIGKQGNSAGEFWLPTGIFISRDQKIYVTDSHNRRIQVFRALPEKTS